MKDYDRPKYITICIYIMIQIDTCSSLLWSIIEKILYFIILYKYFDPFILLYYLKIIIFYGWF